jgi:hypothetical protein
MADGIPADYLHQKWTWFEGNNAWLDKAGHPKKWTLLVRDWWKRDAANWRARQKHSKNSEGEAVTAADRAVIETKLKSEKNPARRRELLARLNQTAV